MRLRIFPIAAVAALTYLAIKHSSELPALPDPATAILSLRVAPFRFTLGTEPEAPNCDTPITLKVHVIDAAGHPADGLIIEADAAMSSMDHGAKHATLRGKGHGNYEGEMELETAGSWEVDLTATKDLKTGRQRLSIEVGGSQKSTEPRNPNEDNSES